MSNEAPTGLMADLAAEAQAAPSQASDGALERLNRLAAEAAELDTSIKDKEAEVEALKAKRNQILTKDMIEVFDLCRTDRLGYTEGFDFVVEPFYSIRLPDAEKEPEKREQVLDWLETNRHGGIVKHVVSVTVSKNEGDLAAAIKAHIEEHFQGVVVESEMTIPWKRYESWLKEQVELRLEAARNPEATQPPPLPIDLLGATIGRVVKIKKRKK